MENLLRFKDYNQSLNEGAKVPVYNQIEFQRNMHAPPEDEISYSKVLAKIKDLLAQKEQGSIEEITVIADVPSQGKGAPEYVKEIIAKERERLARNYKATIGKKMDTKDDGSGEFDFDVDRFGEKRSIYFDSEFLVDGIETVGDKEYIIGIPYSLRGKEEFTAKIKPEAVEEIYFIPPK